MSWLATNEMLENSPSVRDGLTVEQEKADRESMLRFLHDFGELHKIDRRVVHTACVFFQRFFVLQSFKQHERALVAISALFLAGKVEEHPRHLKDIGPRFMEWRKKYRGFESQTPGNDWNKDDDREKLLDSIVVCERILLNTVCFDLEVQHPDPVLHKTLRACRKYLVIDSRMDELKRIARIFINDSYLTDVCLRFSLEAVVTACVLMASMHVNLEPPIDPQTRAVAAENWLQVMSKELSRDRKKDKDTSAAHDVPVTFEDVRAITNAILDVYVKMQGRQGAGALNVSVSSMQSRLAGYAQKHPGARGSSGNGVDISLRGSSSSSSSRSSSSSSSSGTVVSVLNGSGRAAPPALVVTSSVVGSAAVGATDDDSDDDAPPPPPPQRGDDEDEEHGRRAVKRARNA